MIFKKNIWRVWAVMCFAMLFFATVAMAETDALNNAPTDSKVLSQPHPKTARKHPSGEMAKDDFGIKKSKSDYAFYKVKNVVVIINKPDGLDVGLSSDALATQYVSKIQKGLAGKDVTVSIGNAEEFYGWNTLVVTITFRRMDSGAMEATYRSTRFMHTPPRFSLFTQEISPQSDAYKTLDMSINAAARIISGSVLAGLQKGG